MFVWVFKPNQVEQLDFYNLSLICDCDRNHPGKGKAAFVQYRFLWGAGLEPKNRDGKSATS